MPRLLHDWVSEHAGRRPESPAIVRERTPLSYAELETKSTQLARLLKEAGCKRGDRVALLMPQSPMAIVGLLGIYKADCIYVPIDPLSPAVRLRTIFESCQNTWVLACGPVASVLEEILREEQWRRRLRVGWMGPLAPAYRDVPVEFTLHDVARCSTSPVACQNESGDIAHILFTSGSTGTPKGVAITHANVIHFIEWATKHFEMAASDRMSAHAPLHFDISFLDIFGAAAVGAELHLVPRDLNLLPNRLAAFIRASELTQWFSVPSVLTYLANFDAIQPNDFPALKRLMWVGEVLPTRTLMYWMQRLPHVSFTNLYGPTETTIASSYYTVPGCPDDALAPVPIGVACDGEELLVLDESMQPAARGESGEICIGGAGVARGYWRDAERTEAAFVRHPQRPAERLYKTGDQGRVGEDGLVYFLGRNDTQIKSRGYRIELGEIEAALNTLQAVQECAVVAIHTSGFESAVICCAYVPAAGTEVTPATLRRELAAIVLPYMLPARWLAFDRFPLSASGKTDRRRLKEIFEERVAHATQSA